jgi:hypothetical protein
MAIIGTTAAVLADRLTAILSDFGNEYARSVE